MSRQYTRQRAQSGKCSPPTRKSSGKTTVLAEDDHLARAWETVAEKEARYAIGAARAAERSERATASAAARKEARETDRMNELGLAAAIENSLAPPSPNEAAAEQQLKEQLMPMGEAASVSGGGVKAKREACEKAALARKDGAPPERYVSLSALSLYMRAIASASLVYYISTYRCRCRCRCPAC